jgi:hypothetical protein
MADVEFVKFKKIPRLSREIVVSEKIDGTNAVVYIGEDGTFLTGSRNRWISPEKDNFGFAKWAHEHREELLALGPGYHFGEWWGQGIQRGYGLDHKRWSLFNVSRWNEATPPPACCHVVPVLWVGNFETANVYCALENLAKFGSVASSGFMDPEGVVVFHSASGTLFKKTIKGDEKPKGGNDDA